MHFSFLDPEIEKVVMWGTICLLIILVGLLILQILGLTAGRLMWYGSLVYTLWLLYFILICGLFLYREQKHAAKAGSLFKLHDRLIAEASGKESTTGTTATASAPSSSGSGDSLEDEDKML